jgi:hypothetical protein
MKNIFKWFGIIALAAIIGFSMSACGGGGGDDDGGGGGGGGSGSGSGDYKVTINNIHSSYNDIASNDGSFMLFDTASADAISPDVRTATVLNGTVTATFRYRDRMVNWGGIKVMIIFQPADNGGGWFNSTATFPISQKNIIIDAKDMLIDGGSKKLSEPVR